MLKRTRVLLLASLIFFSLPVFANDLGPWIDYESKEESLPAFTRQFLALYNENSHGWYEDKPRETIGRLIADYEAPQSTVSFRVALLEALGEIESRRVFALTANNSGGFKNRYLNPLEASNTANHIARLHKTLKDAATSSNKKIRTQARKSLVSVAVSIKNSILKMAEYYERDLRHNGEFEYRSKDTREAVENGMTVLASLPIPETAEILRDFAIHEKLILRPFGLRALEQFAHKVSSQATYIGTLEKLAKKGCSKALKE